MANNLGRKIEKGEEVVLIAKYFKPGTDLVFICEDGFGMDSFTIGHAIVGTWKADGQKQRIEGWMIDKNETKKHQAKELGNVKSVKRTGTEDTIVTNQGQGTD